MEICNRCKYKTTCSASSESDFCLNYEPRPLTNADRIRAMTDEELAKLLCVMNIDDCPDKAHELHCMDKCYECWLDWLRQEADNGAVLGTEKQQTSDQGETL